MNRRKALAAIAATPLALRATQTRAGGMAVVYLIGDLPRAISGKPFRLRFANLAHDTIDHMWNSFEATITLIPKDGGEPLSFPVAAPSTSMDDLGAYETEITVPEAGRYKWSIKVGPWEPTYFPTLVVESPPSAANPPADATYIAIDTEGFTPSEADISVDTTVIWHNEDASTAHQVTWTSLDLEDSALIPTGGEFQYTFDEPGEYGYFCGPHPSMVGKIIVSESA
ncbi:MAG: cupredoxin domain-containing protein [Thermomicrobiales bacterium]|nr:cupredoxin domain-containing protein [Thermomicrobiales bacterium]